MGNTYEYTGIDTSLIMQVVMGAEVKEAHCKAVVLQEGKAFRLLAQHPLESC